MKEQKQEYEEKLNAKDCELIKLKATNSTLQCGRERLFGELSGLNVVKSLLKEKEDENYKLK